MQFIDVMKVKVPDKSRPLTTFKYMMQVCKYLSIDMPYLYTHTTRAR